MRKTILIGLVLIAISVGTAAETATASDGQIRSTVKYWFGRISGDYTSANTCHGCPSGADSLVSDGQQCMKDLNRIRYYDTEKFHTASTNAFEACRNYALFAISWETSYTDVFQQQKNDDFALAKSRLARARAFARKAAIALRLASYP